MGRKKACAAFGSFEFVHRGHLAVAKKLAEIAKQKNMQSVIVSCPSSAEVYTTEKEKEYLLRGIGIDRFITYNKKTNLDEFLKDLQEEIGVEILVAGENDPEIENLQIGAERLGIQVLTIPSVCCDDRPITYEWLAETFEANNFEMLTKLCGHPYILIGDVVHGKKLGRTVGMPTTNLHIYKKKRRPNCGVYATKVILDEEIYQAATNIGKRPTVDDFDYVTIESFILDFNQQIYGEICVLEVYRYLRGVQKFDSLEQVQEQVKRDVEEIRELFVTI